MPDQILLPLVDEAKQKVDHLKSHIGRVIKIAEDLKEIYEKIDKIIIK